LGLETLPNTIPLTSNQWRKKKSLESIEQLLPRTDGDTKNQLYQKNQFYHRGSNNTSNQQSVEKEEEFRKYRTVAATN